MDQISAIARDDDSKVHIHVCGHDESRNNSSSICDEDLSEIPLAYISDYIHNTPHLKKKFSRSIRKSGQQMFKLIVTNVFYIVQFNVFPD